MLTLHVTVTNDSLTECGMHDKHLDHGKNDARKSMIPNEYTLPCIRIKILN
jgi:hypothetical protein